METSVRGGRWVRERGGVGYGRVRVDLKEREGWLWVRACVL